MDSSSCVILSSCVTKTFDKLQLSILTHTTLYILQINHTSIDWICYYSQQAVLAMSKKLGIESWYKTKLYARTYK